MDVEMKWLLSDDNNNAWWVYICWCVFGSKDLNAFDDFDAKTDKQQKLFAG